MVHLKQFYYKILFITHTDKKLHFWVINLKVFSLLIFNLLLLCNFAYINEYKQVVLRCYKPVIHRDKYVYGMTNMIQVITDS